MKAREQEPKQERSRHTLHRLLSATEALLEHGGLDAATVPAIAKAAGLSVGVVYRRFPDKDMLLRAVYLRFFEGATRPQEHWAPGSFHDIARQLILEIAEAYRRRRGLVRSLILYARTHPDMEFRTVARKLHRGSLFRLKYFLLAHRSQIRHPNPDAAIDFALLAVTSTLQNAVLEEHMPHRLDDELVRLFFRYLGIEK